MTKIENYIKIFKKYGFTEDQNISDFWFKNMDKISKNIFNISGEEGLLSLKIRWASEIGKVCQKEVYDYIVKKQLQKNRSRIDFYTEIDFNDFSFYYNEKQYDLKTFAMLFKTSHVSGITDLRGINLDGISINSCKIKRCFFAEASFKNANFQQNRLIHTNLIKADFTNSRFVAIIVDENSYLNGINFNGAFINAVEMSGKSIGNSIFPFNEVSYFTLIKDTVTKIFQPSKRILFRDRKETIFSGLTITDIKKTQLKRLQQYIDWYQNIYDNLYNFQNKSIIKRVFFLFSILFTKHWSSLVVLSLNVFIINLFFGIIMFWTKSSFDSQYPLSIFDTFYQSIVTFSSLGFGDIVPINSLGQIIVILNVISGY
ncbi:pentapeptide repeat-containing protein, partial [bacterium]|nr:pentapeptide repeat-containing protein [bacterium]